MTGEQIIQLLTSIGLPGTALVILAKWTASRIDASEKASRQREAELNLRVNSLQNELRELEKEVREEVVGAVKESNVVLERNNTLLERNTEIMQKVVAMVHSHSKE